MASLKGAQRPDSLANPSFTLAAGAMTLEVRIHVLPQLQFLLGHPGMVVDSDVEG